MTIWSWPLTSMDCSQCRQCPYGWVRGILPKKVAGDGSTGSPCSSMWATGQPLDPGDEDCLLMVRVSSGWRWHDAACGHTHQYVCSPVSPPLPPLLPSPPSSPPGPPGFPGEASDRAQGFSLSTGFAPPQPGPMNWHAARDDCAARGMQLAIIRSATEQAAVEALIGPGVRSHFWIGATRAGTTQPMTWVDGTYVIGYTNWVGGTGPGSNVNADCVEMYLASSGVGTSSWQWNSVSCLGVRSFICSPLPPPPAPPTPPPSAPPPHHPPPPSAPTAKRFAPLVALGSVALASLLCISLLAVLGRRRLKSWLVNRRVGDVTLADPAFQMTSAIVHSSRVGCSSAAATAPASRGVQPHRP